MQGNLDAAWIGLAGVFLGALVGFSGNYLKLLYDKNRERKELFRGKLETLHEIVAEIDHDCVSEYHFFLTKLKKGLEVEIELGSARRIKHVAQIEMLVSNYAPNCDDAYKKFGEAHVEYTKTFLNEVLDFNGKVKNGADLNVVKDPISTIKNALLPLSEAAADFLECIIKENKKYL